MFQKHSVSFDNISDPCKLMCSLPGELPVEKGTAVDGTSCGVSGICVAGTCIVSFLAPTSLTSCTKCFTAYGL